MIPQTVAELIQYSFYSLVSVLGLSTVAIIKSGVSALVEMKISVESLNGKVSQLIDVTTGHNKELKELDGRLRDLEKKG